MESLSQTLGDLKARADQRIDEVERSYGEGRPLRPFAGIMGAYGAAVVGLGAVAAARRALPDRFRAGDLALYGVATFRLARILAKDPVTSPLRAPFTTLEGTTGPAELHERVDGHGWHHAVGELLTCPFCLGQWVATGFVFGGMVFPRFTRSVAATFVVHAVSDVLQFGYAALERTEQPRPT
jgi:hypothetical protein